MVFALLPGVSGVTLMAMAIPVTLSWGPLPIMLLLGAFLGSATFMGSVTAILLNIPGNTSNAATMIDGHAMARKGEAKTAIGCSATASALGSTFGIVVLILMIRIIEKVLFTLFLLGFVTLTLVLTLKMGSLAGLIPNNLVS